LVTTSYILSNDDDFQAAINRLAKATNDFRIPFGDIAREFYQGNKKIFKLKSAGLYPDFKSAESKAQKIREVGFAYPLLFRTGRLASSLVNASDPETVRNISKTGLELGSDVPYLKYHQSDEPRSKIPLRKAVFIDGGPFEQSKGASRSGRREAWLNIINQYILDNIDLQGF